MADEVFDPRLRLDLRASSTPLRYDFFFRFSFLLDLDLSQRRDIFYLPPSISQCSLLRRINISRTSISHPPPVLFTIPAFREDPARIIFGADERCTPEIAHSILTGCSAAGRCSIKLREPSGGVHTVSFGSQLIPSDVIALAFPSLRDLLPFLFLVRVFHTVRLRIANSNAPLILYLLPKAEWSVELRYLPAVPVCPQARPLVVEIAESRIRKGGAPRFPDLSNVDDLRRDPLLTSRRIDVRAVPGAVNGANRRVTIAITNEWAAITCGETAYYVFPANSIALDVHLDSDGNELLVLRTPRGALLLEPIVDPDRMIEFLLVLAIAAPAECAQAVGPPERKFRALLARCERACAAGKNAKMVGKRQTQEKNAEQVLQELRRVKGQCLSFVRK
jgi:hypothetical protein